MVKKPVLLNIIRNLEFFTIFANVLGLISLLITGYLGLLDSSRASAPDLLNINHIALGFSFALENDFLAFKIRWSLILIQFYMWTILLAAFVYFKNSKGIFESKLPIRVVYLIIILLSMYVLFSISLVGGYIVYGESIFTNFSFLEFLCQQMRFI